MPTTVSGSIKSLLTTGVGSSTNAFVRFALSGTQGNQPTVVGTGAIAPLQSANGQFYCDIAADANGAVSGTIYSTRDATGALGGDISVGGSTTAVYYTMFIYNNGVAGPGTKIHAKNGATLDPSSVTPITTPPVVSAPTGDGTYGRLDGGNTPATGLWQFNAGILTKTVNTIRNANMESGSDIGAKVNAAFTAGSNQCTVYVPAGSYSFSTTINFPVAANGTAQLLIDPGAVLTYTGSGYAIDLAGTGQGNVNAIVKGGRLVGTSSGLAGIHLAKFNKALISDISIESFSAGDAIYNVGANTVNIVNCQLLGNLNGLHNVGSGDGFAANSVKMYYCHIKNNTGWGWYEDNSGQGGGTGGNLSNLAHGCTFEFNGSNSNSSTSGHVFINSGANHKIDGACYFEYSGSSTVTNSIKIGDGSVSPINCSIKNSSFTSKGTTNTIIAYATNLRVEDNYESQTNTNFFNQVSGATNTALGYNRVGSTNPTAGASTGYAVNQIAGAATMYFPQTVNSSTVPQEFIESGASGTEVEVAFGRTAIEHRIVAVASAGTYVGDSQVGDLVIRSDAGVIRLGQTGGNSSVQIGNGTFAVGGGTNLTNIKVYSQSLTPSSVNAATCSEQSFTVTGVTTSDKIIFNPPTQSTAVFPAYAYVSATNTVKIGFINPTAGALTPSSGTYLFIAIRS